MPSCAAWVEISLISTVWDLKKVFALLAKLLELHRFNQHYQASVHRGSALASHPADPGLNPGSAEIFSLYCLAIGQYCDGD